MRPNHEIVRENLLYALRGVHEGRVFGPEITYLMPVHGDATPWILQPDASFIYADRLTPQTDTLRPFYGMPDLAMMVTRARDTHAETLLIWQNYMSYQVGVPELWVVDVPILRLVQFQQVTFGTWRSYESEEDFAPDHLFPRLLIDVGALFDGVVE